MTILFAWDFNGVLEKDCKKATIDITNRALKAFGKRAMSEAKFEEMYGRPWIDFFQEMCPDSSDSEIDAINERAYKIAVNEKPFLKFDVLFKNIKLYFGQGYFLRQAKCLAHSGGHCSHNSYFFSVISYF